MMSPDAWIVIAAVLASLASAARADERGSGRVSGARTIELPRWPLASLASAAHAQDRPDPGEIRGLKLGLKAQALTLDGFGDLACGSNGGPARQRIERWSDFGQCRPDDTG